MRGLGSGHVTCGEDLSNERICLLHRGLMYIHTYGHRNSMTESAQLADSVKSKKIWENSQKFRNGKLSLSSFSASRPNFLVPCLS